jgi:alkylation response protein AidB-like acyl-CoA dehydrogenase
MVAPVIMAFGNAEQQKRFLPGIASGEVWWSQGYSEPGSGSDLASVKTKAERKGDKYIVNGQKTWTTLGQYGDWMFNLVRTSNEGKPQTGISFLLLDMKSPGVTVRPIKLLDGGHEVNEVFFDNVEVPAENLIGEENKGWTYAKHLLSHERTNIADVNRAKRELERLKRIAKAEGVYDDARFRDEIAKLEVDIVALEMMVLRVLSAATSGKNSLDVAGLLKIRGSEIQQRYSELMMLAGGPIRCPSSAKRWKPAGKATSRAATRRSRRSRPPSSTCARPPSTAVRTKCNATSSRRRSWAEETRTWISISPTTRNSCATPCASGSTRAMTSSAAAASRPRAVSRARPGTNWPSSAWAACTSARKTAAWAWARWPAWS